MHNTLFLNLLHFHTSDQRINLTDVPQLAVVHNLFTALVHVVGQNIHTIPIGVHHQQQQNKPLLLLL